MASDAAFTNCQPPTKLTKFKLPRPTSTVNKIYSKLNRLLYLKCTILSFLLIGPTMCSKTTCSHATTWFFFYNVTVEVFNHLVWTPYKMYWENCYIDSTFITEFAKRLINRSDFTDKPAVTFNQCEFSEDVTLGWIVSMLSSVNVYIWRAIVPDWEKFLLENPP
uniref:Innexin n=1 Tax=Panagrellus redivivus TaxID=6233 RepID=A0A7E4V8G7_PANRE